MISKKVKVSLLVAAILGIFSTQAQQKRRGQPNPDKIMAKVDSDENGTISLEEFKAARMNQDFKDEVVEKRFRQMDMDDNGQVNLDELKKAIEHRKHRRGKRL